MRAGVPPTPGPCTHPPLGHQAPSSAPLTSHPPCFPPLLCVQLALLVAPVGALSLFAATAAAAPGAALWVCAALYVLSAALSAALARDTADVRVRPAAAVEPPKLPTASQARSSRYRLL